jgi:hypothetical protein
MIFRAPVPGGAHPSPVQSPSQGEVCAPSLHHAGWCRRDPFKRRTPPAVLAGGVLPCYELQELTGMITDGLVGIGSSGSSGPGR